MLDDQPAVTDLCFIDKPGKATYIRNKKQSFVFHFLFKIITNKNFGSFLFSSPVENKLIRKMKFID